MAGVREALRSLPRGVFADLLESEDEYLFVIDVPGATGETTEVWVADSTLRVEARREKDVPSGFTFRREDRSVFVDVTIPLPLDASTGGADASVSDGVLEVTIPKMNDGYQITIEDAE